MIVTPSKGLIKEVLGIDVLKPYSEIILQGFAHFMTEMKLDLPLEEVNYHFKVYCAGCAIMIITKNMEQQKELQWPSKTSESPSH